MRPTVGFSVLGGAFALLLLSQVPSAFQLPEPKSSLSTPPKRGDTVTLEGCITGATFTDRKTRLTYRLKGAKELMRRVDVDHQGHIDAVTGTVKSDRKFETERRRTIGKTTFLLGVREKSVVPTEDVEPEGPDPVIEVTSITHLGGGCPPG